MHQTGATSSVMRWSRHQRPQAFILAILRALSLSLMWLLTTPAGAGAIPVNNPSFETLPPGGLSSGCGFGCSYVQDFIPGWINNPGGWDLSSGQFRPGPDAGNTTYFDTLSDGPTSAYCNNGSIQQITGITVQAGLTYTLTVDVGWRKDAGPTGFPRLLVNGVYYDPAPGTAVFGGWAPFTTTYVARPQDVGASITIVLSSVSFQGNFDNVRFSDSPGAGRLLGDRGLPGPPLTLTRAGTDLDLAWAGSCDGASDFAIYEGLLGDPRSKLPVRCSTGGATIARITPSSGARFYLVVPRTAAVEGSYGHTSAGLERPPDAGACLPQSIAACP